MTGFCNERSCHANTAAPACTTRMDWGGIGAEEQLRAQGALPKNSDHATRGPAAWAHGVAGRVALGAIPLGSPEKYRAGLQSLERAWVPNPRGVAGLRDIFPSGARAGSLDGLAPNATRPTPRTGRY